MKILQVIPTLNSVGGAEKFVMELSASLQKLGQEVIILSLYSKKNDFFDKFIQENGLNVMYLNKKRGVDLKVAKAMISLINKIKPDVIHGHLRFHLTLMLGGRKKIKNIPFIETFHHDFATASENILLKMYASKLYNKRIVVPVAISTEVKRTAIKYFGIKKDIPMIYNGIGLPVVKVNPPLMSRKNDFITVSTIYPIKNHNIMINAVVELKRKGYNPNLTIIGKGELFSDIDQKIINNKLESNVFLLGEQKNVFDHLISHKFFLLPSFSEGNPLSLLEAMACGLVPIVTNIGGPKDIVGEKNGYLVDPHDVNTLVKAMEEVINNPEKNEVLSKNNYEKSIGFDINNTAKEYLELYIKIKQRLL